MDNYQMTEITYPNGKKQYPNDKNTIPNGKNPLPNGRNHKGNDKRKLLYELQIQKEAQSTIFDNFIPNDR